MHVTTIMPTFIATIEMTTKAFIIHVADSAHLRSALLFCSVVPFDQVE